MLHWNVITSTIPRIFVVVAALLIPQLGYAAGVMNMPTTCGDPIWGKKLWLYTGFYSIPFIEIEQSLLLEQLTGVERNIDRQDKIIHIADTITSVGNAMGAREAKDILSSAIGSASTVMDQNAAASGNFSFIIAKEIVDGAGELLDGLTDPPALARDLAIKLSNTFLNYINYWQITNLTNRLDFLRHVDEFMFSYYHSCGASSSLSSLTSSESSAVGNYLLGVNKTYASLESTNNPVPVNLPTQGQLLPAPALSASLVGASVSITPTFSWSPVSGANKYWLMVAKNQADLPGNTAATGCQNCVISGSTFQTTYTPPNAFSNIGRTRILEANSTYYWQVMAFNDTSASSAGNYSVQQRISTTSYSSSTSPPASPINLTATPSIWAGSALFSLDWTNPSDVTGISKVWWKLNTPPNSSSDGAAQDLPSFKPLQIAVPSEGATSLYVWLQNNAGSSDYRNAASVILKYDATPPIISITSPTTLATFSATTSPIVLAGSVVDPQSGSGVRTVIWVDNHGNSGNANVNGTNWSSSPINLAQGINLVTIWAIDNAGNFAVSQIAVDFSPAIVSSSVCGSSAGGTFTSVPTANLCPPGSTASTPSGIGPWFWSCASNGVVNNCAANIQTSIVSAAATGGAGGSIVPSFQSVNYGSTTTLTVTPNSGARASVSGCGISQSWITSPTILTTSNITGGCTVTATFAPNPSSKYSKICNNGQDAGQGSCPADPALGSATTDWACIRDNTNGLLWEVKTVDGGLRDKNSTYTWYDANPRNNGGNSGVRNGGVCVGGRCDTSGFADAVAAIGLCGTSDWRVPTHDELVTLVDATSANNGLAAIEGSYFPNTLEAPYWSSSSYAGDSTTAWEMSFFHQYADGTYAKGWHNRTRLVRGGTPRGPFALTVSLVGSGSVSSIPVGINCSSSCTQSLDGGATVTLSATPDSGYLFAGWGGACTGASATCTVIMSQYRDITATFSSLAFDGSCGGVNGYYLTSQPIASLCSKGTASAVTGSGPWNWSCIGSNGGATASCTAYLQPGGTPLPSMPISGFSSGFTVGASSYGITSGPDGNVWFTESNGNRIGRITPTGLIAEFSNGLSSGAGLNGITAGPDGNLWFTESGPDRIGRITPSGTITEYQLPVGATPLSIASGPDGNLWFTGYSQIGRITPSGAITIFSAGITAGANPQSITRGPDGNLWFTELSGNRIGRITPAGTVTEFSLGMSPGANPYGITAGPDGNLWFTELGGNRIGRITPDGIITEFSVSSNAYGIATGSDGNLWFIENGNNRIGRMTPTGTLTEFNSSNIIAPNLTAGPDGNLWFSVSTQNMIGRVTLVGAGTTIALGTVSPFSAQVGSTSAAQNLSLGNTGSTTLNISSILANGDFAQSGCGTTLAAGASCSVSVTFAPTAVGPRNGNLKIISDAAGSPHTVSLIGTGTAVAAPDASLSAAALTFAAQAVGITSTGQSVTLTNIGNAPLNVSSVVTSGDFTGVGNCGTSTTGTVLAVGQACSISVVFVPTTTGTRTGAVSITSNAASGPSNISLSGVGALDTQTITFGAAPAIVVGGTGTIVATGGSSGKPVVFSTTTPSICTVSGSTVTGVNAGDCVIAANQSGNVNYSAALQATQIITVPAATQTLTFSAGWNLVGNSYNVALDVASTFGDPAKVISVWKWIRDSTTPANDSKWAFFSPNNGATITDNGAAYAANKGYLSLATIKAGDGYWINATGPFTVTVPTGRAVISSDLRGLPTGWNLVSTGNQSTPSRFNIDLNNVPPSPWVIPINITSLWVWDGILSKWYFYSSALEAQGGTSLLDYTVGKGYLDFPTTGRTLGPGIGFWLNVPQ